MRAQERGSPRCCFLTEAAEARRKSQDPRRAVGIGLGCIVIAPAAIGPLLRCKARHGVSGGTEDAAATGIGKRGGNECADPFAAFIVEQQKVAPKSVLPLPLE